MHYLNDLMPMQNSHTPIQIRIKLNISSMNFIMIKLNHFNNVLVLAKLTTWSTIIIDT